MKVIISKPGAVSNGRGGLKDITRMVAQFDIPEDVETTIYVDHEPALVIEP